MRADVLQAVGICCHGNAFLQGRTDHRAPELLSWNSTFRNVAEVSFERNSGTSAFVGGLVAEGTSPWLRKLASEGVESLRLILFPCTFNGENSEEPIWGILSDGDVGLELWHPKWKGRLVRYGEPSSWKVTYTSQRYNRWSVTEPTLHNNAAEQLTEAMETGLLFCRSNGFPEMGEWFDKCLQLQRRGDTACPIFFDLTPESMDPEMRALCATAMRCLIVIGSAPWTEALMGEHERDFQKVTDMIWKASLTAFESGAVESASRIARAA